MFLDSHCHINDEALIKEADLVIEKAKENNVKIMAVVGWDFRSSEEAVEIASNYDGVFAMVGIHPENLDGISENDLEKVKKLAENPKVIAIGEIGLDYHWFKEEKDRNKQKEWFIKQIDLANKLDLPVSIHARDALGDTLELLQEHPVKRKGVLHCYSGSLETMRELMKLGYYFGFDGPITFKNAKEPKECVKECPLDRILSETDSPYMAPAPHRGERNEPKYIPLIVNQMAMLKNISLEEVENAILNNFKKLFYKANI